METYAFLLHPRISKEDAAQILRASKNAITSDMSSEPEYRAEAEQLCERIAMDIAKLFGPEAADVLTLAFGFAIVPGTHRHV